MKKIHFRVADRIIDKTALRYRKWSGKLLYSALVFRHLNRRLGGNLQKLQNLPAGKKKRHARILRLLHRRRNRRMLAVNERQIVDHHIHKRQTDRVIFETRSVVKLVKLEFEKFSQRVVRRRADWGCNWL